MNRQDLLKRLEQDIIYDILIIGGGASGLGVALDAVSRGLKVCLVEKSDFGKGTSSKATKLLHGGVRYMAQGDLGLVIEALRERAYVLKQAPHLSKVQEFIIPIYNRWQGFYYFLGLKFYEWLAGAKSLGKSRLVNKEYTIASIGNLLQKDLKGGVVYYDGQFDDSRLCIDLVKTILSLGGDCLNYCEVIGFVKDNHEKINGALLKDGLGQSTYKVSAKIVVNATGVWSENTMSLDKSSEPPIKIVPARGSHITVDKKFLGGNAAIMIPKTSDGRVLFVIPWLDSVIIGTTDVVSNEITSDPKATTQEIEFMLSTAKSYLQDVPTLEDIQSTFAGLRPLVAPKSEMGKSKEISRSHKVVFSKNGLYSLLGGKWTTFRKMGEDTLNKIALNANFNIGKSTSSDIKIANDLPNLTEDRIHAELPYSWNQIDHIIRTEMVEQLEDLLGRRTRAIFLNKKATLDTIELMTNRWLKIRTMPQNWAEDQKEKFLKFSDSF